MTAPKFKTAVNPQLFDAHFDRSKRDPRIIWTLAGIGKRIGVGADFVRDTLATQPGSPVKQIGGRYYAFEEDLIAFLRALKT